MAKIVLRICKCGKWMKVKEYRIKAGRGKFCSKKCQYKYMIRPAGLKYKFVKENKGRFKSRNSIWKDSKGYLQCWHKGKNKRMHILIVENFVGRSLYSYEVVHHINGIKTDNRIENLQLMNKKDHDYLHRGRSIKIL